MKILGYTWAGVPTADFAATARFFEGALGLPVVKGETGADIARFELPSGQVLEVLGPRSFEHGFIRAPALGFEVDDVQAARAELDAQGIRFLTPVAFSAAGDTAWTYFVGPDGFVYEIWQRVGARSALPNP